MGVMDRPDKPSPHRSGKKKTQEHLAEVKPFCRPAQIEAILSSRADIDPPVVRRQAQWRRQGGTAAATVRRTGKMGGRCMAADDGLPGCGENFLLLYPAPAGRQIAGYRPRLPLRSGCALPCSLLRRQGKRRPSGKSGPSCCECSCDFCAMSSTRVCSRCVGGS